MRISRRAALRGLGGTLLALPALELMLGSEAAAQPAATRYLVSFCGASIGRHTTSTEHGDLFVPSNLGSNYELTRALTPLGNIEGFGSVAQDVSVVSNLLIPWAVNGVVPAGGRPAMFHEYFMSPLLSGVRSESEQATVASINGPTSDWIMSAALAGGTVFDNLVYKVQAHSYLGDNGNGGARSRMSYRMNGDSLEAVDGVVNPKQAYDTLFTGFEPDDPVEKELRAFELSRRKSVIDLVGTQSASLMKTLGSRDRQRMEKHYDEIRVLEKRLHALGSAPGGACSVIGDPGSDWPIGNGGVGEDYEVNAGYSNEDERALVLSDLICMAFACDRTRTAALMFTHPHSWMNMYQLTGAASDFHELTHGGNGAPGATPLESLSDALAWHVKHFGRIVAKLRESQEPDGTSLLDHTALVLMFEGGHGYDPSDGAPNRAHSTENMAALIAGRVGGLKSGIHVDGAERHPAQVVISAMKAAGGPQELGEVSGVIDELF